MYLIYLLGSGVGACVWESQHVHSIILVSTPWPEAGPKIHHKGNKNRVKVIFYFEIHNLLFVTSLSLLQYFFEFHTRVGCTKTSHVCIPRVDSTRVVGLPRVFLVGFAQHFTVYFERSFVVLFNSSLEPCNSQPLSFNGLVRLSPSFMLDSNGDDRRSRDLLGSAGGGRRIHGWKESWVSLVHSRA